jgi:short-subunit dehydrogenase
MKKLTKENFGEWAVITGASSGIGREMALIISKSGINIVLIARSEEALNKLSSEIKKESEVETKVIVSDLSQAQDIDDIIKQCNNIEVGLLINSAGYALSGEFADNLLEDEIAMLNVNVKAPLILSHHFAKQMKKRQKGGILFMSSIMALAGAAKWAHYNATKAHNLLLAEGLAQELRKDNVKVLAVIAGSVNSGFQERSKTQSAVGAMNPHKVDKWSLWMLSCKRTYIPGIMNKLIALSTRLNPRIINTAIFSAVVNKLTTPKGA